MQNIQVELDSQVAALLQGMGRPMQQTAQELIILELYRRGTISSGKAAEVLGMSRWELVRYAGRLGIPFFEMTEDEWASEKALIDQL